MKEIILHDDYGIHLHPLTHTGSKQLLQLQTNQRGFDA
jgi:dTDP-glucose pyrophosphorylase